jgi:hypothetical protein
MKYKASLDTLAKIMTLGVFILFAFIDSQAFNGLQVPQGDRTSILIFSGIVLPQLAIIIVCWLYAPQSYTVDGIDLTINRLVSKVKIQLADITQARLLADGEMRGSIRTFGNGGLFGYYGKYYNSKIGQMTLYTTQIKNRILILTAEGKKIIISPDDTSIIEKIKK